MSRFVLSRRAVLRGAAGALALPLLDAMLDSRGEALAQGMPLPRRFGIFFWGNGYGWGSGTSAPQGWIPQGTGPTYQPVEQLGPLAPVKSDVSVLTGFAIPGADQHPHFSGMCSVLSGRPWKNLTTDPASPAATFTGPSYDQVLATRLGALTPFRSLELGVVPKHYIANEGTVFNGISHNGPSSVNFPEFSPRAAFNRLFASELASAAELAARRSVLDSAKADAAKLNGRLGARDRQRLDQHLESIRSIELRLAQPPTSCQRGAAPVDVVDPAGIVNQKVRDRNLLMADLLATALACDLTRSFTYMFSFAGTGTVFSEAGAVEMHHAKCHDEAAPQPTVRAITTYIMERLRDVVLALKARPEGSGSLLDRCAMLCTSELSYGRDHRNDEFPLLVAGGGGGALRRGIHYRSATKENPTAVTLALMRSVDPTLTELGVDEHRCTTPLPALVA